MIRALSVVLLLGACAAQPVESPDRSAVYRDGDITIASNALFDPRRFGGTWYEVARYPVAFQAGCVGARSEYTLQAGGTFDIVNTCGDGPSAGVARRIEGRARVVGPGRLSVDLDGVATDAPYWVLWVDEGYRTAVIGMPSGRAGWILNRDVRIPPDRLAAAREVLAFNGYDLSRMVHVPPAP
ncbi:lipocalin family protein [Oceaniglobus indicus]|uniref:lipocalin family protein n=1 Tax=Oceaniglobus indicus TaxID=2047749 RepID=UPI000C182973|nr:lipocalin family protein [Oceaniglobus indicus]